MPPRRIHSASVAAALATLVAAASAGETAPSPRPVIAGVRHGHRTTTVPRPLEIHWIEVDLACGGIAVEAVAAPDPDGDGPAEASLVEPRELVALPGVVAAVNANAFRPLPGADGTASTDWKATQPVTISGWARTPHGDASEPEAPCGQFWVDATGRAHVDAGGDRAEAVAAVAGFGLLVADGRSVAGGEEALHPRTAVGTDAAGRRLWLVVVDGRRAGVSEGMTVRELAALMQELGCTDALNLDGGGSSVLLAADEAGRLGIANRPSGAGTRPVPVMLAVRAAAAERRAPRRTDPGRRRRCLRCPPRVPGGHAPAFRREPP